MIPIEPEATKKDLGSSASYVKGPIALKGEVKGEIVEKGKDSAAVSAGGTSNAGGQAEITLGEQMGYAIFDSLNIEKVTETMAFELSKKKLDVSFGAEATIKNRYEWLKGIVGLESVIAGVEWDRVSDAVALGVEVPGGLSGEGVSENQTRARAAQRNGGWRSETRPVSRFVTSGSYAAGALWGRPLRLRYDASLRARSSADRASDFGSDGRGFESLRARQTTTCCGQDRTSHNCLWS